MGGLWYRPCAGVVSAVGLALNGGAQRDAVLVAVAVGVAAATGIVAMTAGEAVWSGAPVPLRWMVADAVVLATLNLWGSATVTGSLAAPFSMVFWAQMQGALVMWWAAAGTWAGLSVAGLGLPLVLAMIRLNGAVTPEQVPAVVLTNMMWLALAVLVVLLFGRLLETRSVVARHEGMRTGRELQRLRHLREVHDTVLQTLEAIALQASMTQVGERERLTAIAEEARAEAARLRRGLRAVEEQEEEDAYGGGEDIHALLGGCVEDFRGRGLRVTLMSSAALTPALLPPPVARAVRDATFEALTNVLKHARARRVRVGIDHRPDGLDVVVQDDGRGFDPATTPERFGLAQSIRQRLADVGGQAVVASQPGRGTRVTLSVRRPPEDAGTGPA